MDGGRFRRAGCGVGRALLKGRGRSVVVVVRGVDLRVLGWRYLMYLRRDL
jgi:hypothetical protein